MGDGFRIFPDRESVARAAADFLADEINACVSAKGVCHVALPGGTTPARCLGLLSHKDLPWQRIHWYLGDERCYPVGHGERNDSMITQSFWSKIDAPAENRHPIPAELGAELAAEQYAGLIKQIGSLDIVVLGMGEDGHTASLFPENPATANDNAVVPVYNAPKPPAERVSLGFSAIQAAGLRIVLVTGKGKSAAIARVKQGIPLPVSRIGPAHWFVDEAAVYNSAKGH